MPAENRSVLHLLLENLDIADSSPPDAQRESSSSLGKVPRPHDVGAGTTTGHRAGAEESCATPANWAVPRGLKRASAQRSKREICLAHTRSASAAFSCRRDKTLRFGKKRGINCCSRSNHILFDLPHSGRSDDGGRRLRVAERPSQSKLGERQPHARGERFDLLNGFEYGTR